MTGFADVEPETADRGWRWERQAGPGTRYRVRPRPGHALDPASREHVEYLNRMAAEGVVPPGLATKAKAVWWVARALADRGLLVPFASALPGGPVEYHWVAGPHQLLVEIPADGPCHWTYRNGDTGELWGVEAAAEEGLSPKLLRALNRVAAGTR